MDIKQFAQSIKQKYPQYNTIDDDVLGNMMISKYPQYKAKITGFTPSVEDEIKSVSLERNKLALEADRKSMAPYVPGVQPQGSGFATNDKRPSLGYGVYKTQTGTESKPLTYEEQVADIEKRRLQDYKWYPERRADIDAQYDTELRILDPSGQKAKSVLSDAPENAKKRKVASVAKEFIDTVNSLNGDYESPEAKRKLAFAAGKYNTTAATVS